MFFSAVLLPIAFGVAVAEGEPALFFIPLAVFVAGLVWMIYSRLFGEVSEALTHQKPEEVKGSGEWRSLPPMHIDGIAGSRTQRVDTAEMLQPPSVTERTTNLLRKE